MKKNNSRILARTLYDACQKAGPEKQREIIKKFVLFLAKKNYLQQMSRVIKELTAYDKEKSGIKKIEVTVAQDLKTEDIEKMLGAEASKMEIEKKIDPSLLGGIIVRWQDKIFDASIKKQLILLKNSIK